MAKSWELKPAVSLWGTQFSMKDRRRLNQRGFTIFFSVLGCAVPPGSPNSDFISDQKCHFPHWFSDLAFRQKLCHPY